METKKPRFGPPPRSDFEMAPPSDEEIASFRENGFLVVERLTSDEEIAWIRQIFEFVFSPEEAGKFGAPIDRTGTREEGEAPNLTQAFHPEFRFPELLRTTHQRNARRYAAALLGVEEAELTSWGHMIRKEPGGRAALWHQDHAYWEPEFDYCALGVWLPMHDVDASKAVACPLAMGGATFHHFQTLHYTAPNIREQPRLAYPVEFQVKPVRRSEPRDMPWVLERRAVTGDDVPGVYIADGQALPA